MIQECGNEKVKETWKNNTSVSKQLQPNVNVLCKYTYQAVAPSSENAPVPFSHSSHFCASITSEKVLAAQSLH